MNDRHKLTPPQTTMWPSPPRLSLSISSTVSPAAMVVLAQSAVFSVREKAGYLERDPVLPFRHVVSMLTTYGDQGLFVADLSDPDRSRRTVPQLALRAAGSSSIGLGGPAPGLQRVGGGHAAWHFWTLLRRAPRPLESDVKGPGFAAERCAL